MKTCTCGGQLLRHGANRYKSGAVSYRYICKDCRRAITAPITEDTITGKLHFSTTGRSTLKDWRYTTGR